MKKITLKTNTSLSLIYIGDVLTKLEKYIPKNSIIITDMNVYMYYKSFLSDYKTLVIKPGEQSKSIKRIEEIIRKLIGFKSDRETLLVGFGGGVVTDITGFAASIFYRGVNFGFIPTTLLGQVDASIGGKNGVNFNSIKNVIGTINQPKFILSDINTLKTLNKTELLNGTVEAIKTAIVSDMNLYKYVVKNYQQIIDQNQKITENIVYRTSKIKVNIVQQDEREFGLRRILNFGHTFGHAIESLTGTTHGQAVKEGMIIALKLSQKLCELDKLTSNKIITFLSNIQFQKKLTFDKKNVFNFLTKDKKRYDNLIKLVLLNEIGKPIIKEIEINKLRKIYYDMC